MFLLYIVIYILMIYRITDTQYGWTALHSAVKYGHLNCAKLFVVTDADTTKKDTVNLIYKTMNI